MQYKRKRSNMLLLLLFPFTFFSQLADKDSMKALLNTSRADTENVNTLNRLGWEYYMVSEPDSALHYARAALQLAQQIRFRAGEGKAHNTLGAAYNFLGNFPKALESYFRSLRVRTMLGDRKGQASLYNNIGLVYEDINDFDKAIFYFDSALIIAKQLGDMKIHARIRGNLANAFYYTGKTDTALKINRELLAFHAQSGQRSALGACYLNIGNILTDNKEYAEALENFEASRKIKEELHDINGLANVYNNIGIVHMLLKQMDKALANCMKSLDYAKQLQSTENIMQAEEFISRILEETGRHTEALQHYKSYIAARDSLYNEENTKKTVQAEMNFEFEKKEAASKAEQEKKDAVNAAEKKRQNIILWSVCGSLLLVAGFAAYAWRSFMQKKKTNVEITRQKEIIEQKQKEILDSIHYALRIQRALITSETSINRWLKKLKK